MEVVACTQTIVAKEEQFAYSSVLGHHLTLVRLDFHVIQARDIWTSHTSEEGTSPRAH